MTTFKIESGIPIPPSRRTAELIANIKPWLASAKAGKPDHGLLLKLCPYRNLVAARMANSKDPIGSTGMIAFDIKAPRLKKQPQGTKTRFMWPEYFAVLLVFARTKGVSIAMHRARTKDDEVVGHFYVDITIGKRQTNVARILFNTPSNIYLGEAGDHRLIAPETYQQTLGISRAEAVTHVRSHWEESADLLKDLFRLADSRHGHKLAK